MTGNEFRKQLERKITAAKVEARKRSTAPEEVVHRVVDGETVIARRFHHAR